MKIRMFTIDYGEEYEILKTVKNTIIKNSTEINEELDKPHTDMIIRSLKKSRVSPLFSELF